MIQAKNLTLLGEYSEIHTQPVYKVCGQKVEFLMLMYVHSVLAIIVSQRVNVSI
jgi:hypothetical protein